MCNVKTVLSFVKGGFNHDKCTSNAYSGCKKEGSKDHPINPVQSARLRSKRGFTFKYGKVEVEAKLPKGDWIWPGKYTIGKFITTLFCWMVV